MKNAVTNTGEDRYLTRICHKLVVFKGYYLVTDFLSLYLQEEEPRPDGGVRPASGLVSRRPYNRIGDDRSVHQYSSVRNVTITEFN